MKVKVLGYTIILAFLILFAESFLFISQQFVPPISAKFYQKPEVTKESYDEYLEERHPILGWPTKSWIESRTDAYGARKSPANASRSDKNVCVSLYGDSFTYSAEVEDESAWGNILADALDCQVKNYGVGGYGTDQALVRLQLNLEKGLPQGRDIILGLYPDNLKRIHNQWRYLILSSGAPALNFKPAFIQNGEELYLKPLFSGHYGDFQNLIANPGKYLPEDGYLPEGQSFYSASEAQFPLITSFSKMALKAASQIRLNSLSDKTIFWNYPNYYDSPNGPSAAKFQIFSHILEKFGEACQTANANCYLLLIPDPELVYQKEKMGDHDLSQQISEIVPPNVRFLDATNLFKNLEDICNSLTRPPECKGHYGAIGNHKLSDFVVSELTKNGR